MTLSPALRTFQSVFGFKLATFQWIIPPAVAHCVSALFLFSYSSPSHFQRGCSLFSMIFAGRGVIWSKYCLVGEHHMCPPPPAPHTKCTWPTLFICMRMFSLRCCHQAIWMGSLHSDSPVTEYDWGQAGLSRSAGVYIIVCVVEQHDLLVQCEGFTLLQVCVLSLMRLICHRCLRGCVCVCVCLCTLICVWWFMP